MTPRFLLATLYLIFILLISGCKKNTTLTNSPLEDSSPASMTQNVYGSSSIGNLGYWLYKPENAKDNMSLIIYLHGGSGRGTDLNLIITGSLPQFLKDGTVTSNSAYVLMPQCPANKTWEQIGASVKELIDKIVADKKINLKKISLTGHSLGGTGTWNLGATYISLFSCIAPLSGSVNTGTAANYKTIPVWAFVGSADSIVDPASSESIVPSINSAGGNAQIKIYSGASHFDVPTLVYKDQSAKLLEWMSAQTKN